MQQCDKFSIESVLTIKRERGARKEENFGGYPEESCSCCVCDKLFDDLLEFEEHMKAHGTPFNIEAEKRYANMLKMSVSQDDKGKIGKFVFKIPYERWININRFVLVIPPRNHFQILRFNKQGSYTEFDIYYGNLSTADHPYSILVFYTVERKSFFLTQYSFTIEKLFYEEQIMEEYIKVSRRKKLDPFIKKAILTPLPDFNPSPIMLSLSKNKFFPRVTEEENLLTMLNTYLEYGVTKRNYTSFWITFVEMEDCIEIEQFSKHDKFSQRIKPVDDIELYLLRFPNASTETPKIVPGIDLIITSLPNKEKIYAVVHQVMRNDIVLEVVLQNDQKMKERSGNQINGQRVTQRRPTALPKLCRNTLYDVQFLSSRSTMQLMRQALDYVEQQNIAKFFFPDTALPTLHMDKIYQSYDAWEWINESVKTNPEQQSAIIHIVEKTSFPAPYILLGPPGTGKTTTVVETVCQIVKRDPNAHILISASSNDAVDVIALKLLAHLPKTSVYRMFASSKEDDLSIDPTLKEISNLKYNCHYYPHVMELSRYNVILTTLSVAGKFAQAGIRNTFFSYVFIDECGSSSEPSTLVPIAGVITSKDTIHGQIILAGDPMQLGPVVLSDRAEPRLGISLLERLVDTGIYARGSNGKYNPRVMTKLLQNYRSHPKILEFSNEKFYNGELLALGKPETTQWACNWKSLPNKSIPILFENVIGRVERDNNSSSMYNMREVERVVHHIETLLATETICGREVTAKSIGVISPYKLQCNKIEDACRKKSWDIDVGSVERFQGQERPVIILSTVRSQTHSVGFLNNPKRLNVALTRAQALLIVVGNVNTLETDATWRQFVDFCRENDLITEVVEEKPHNQKKSGKKTKNKRGKSKARVPKIPIQEMQALNIGSPLALPVVPTAVLKDFKTPDIGSVESLALSDVATTSNRGRLCANRYRLENPELQEWTAADIRQHYTGNLIFFKSVPSTPPRKSSRAKWSNCTLI